MKLWDPIRSQWIAKTPEEEVRQAVICKLLALGYPKGLISVEKGRKRRYDLLCFMREGEACKPLLLVECKADVLQGEQQVLGYNWKIGAPFVCLAAKTEIKVFWRAQDGVRSVPFLPPFSQLIEGL